jgi:hypothetical protein
MRHTMKLWERVIEHRFRGVTNATKNQFGFKPKRDRPHNQFSYFANLWRDIRSKIRTYIWLHRLGEGIGEIQSFNKVHYPRKRYA